MSHGILNECEITVLTPENAQLLAEAFQSIGWFGKSLELFIQYLSEQSAGIRSIFVAKYSNQVVGYVTILWTSDHLYFVTRSIPEIKDFNILPTFQRQGFAKRLLQYAEHEISKRYSISGIGVGLTIDYAVAQVFYIKHGYVPNGEGVTHMHQALQYEDNICVNYDTVLWMTKI